MTALFVVYVLTLANANLVATHRAHNCAESLWI
uniref:Uncharacterized protein n=1 Tax=Anguilla anguilla TaxID=7936 RepID=A0A0E9REM5_ANGAN